MCRCEACLTTWCVSRCVSYLTTSGSTLGRAGRTVCLLLRLQRLGRRRPRHHTLHCLRRLRPSRRRLRRVQRLLFSRPLARGRRAASGRHVRRAAPLPVARERAGGGTPAVWRPRRGRLRRLLFLRRPVRRLVRPRRGEKPSLNFLGTFVQVCRLVRPRRSRPAVAALERVWRAGARRRRLRGGRGDRRSTPPPRGASRPLWRRRRRRRLGHVGRARGVECRRRARKVGRGAVAPLVDRTRARSIGRTVGRRLAASRPPEGLPPRRAAGAVACDGRFGAAQGAPSAQPRLGGRGSANPRLGPRLPRPRLPQQRPLLRRWRGGLPGGVHRRARGRRARGRPAQAALLHAPLGRCALARRAPVARHLCVRPKGVRAPRRRRLRRHFGVGGILARHSLSPLRRGAQRRRRRARLLTRRRAPHLVWSRRDAPRPSRSLGRHAHYTRT